MTLFKFQDFSAPEYDAQRKFKWNLIYATENVYNPYVTSMTDVGRKQIAENILNEFNNDVIPKLRRLPKQWIHGDLNNFNVLQHEFDESNEIVGIIDSDNMVYTYRVVELATMLMYLTTISTGERSIEIAQQAFRGYCSLIELNEVKVTQPLQNDKNCQKYDFPDFCLILIFNQRTTFCEILGVKILAEML